VSPRRRRDCRSVALLIVLLLSVIATGAAQQSKNNNDDAPPVLVDRTSHDHGTKLPPDVASPDVNPPAPPQSNPSGGGMAGALTQTPEQPAKGSGKYDVNHIGARGIGNGLNLYSLEREMALGRSLAEEVELQSRLITDPAVNDFINQLAQRLVRNSDARVPFTVKIVDNEEVNAFALPGGFFYINSGLIMAADSEAGLAGVMAHEIAHVAARHATKQATRSQIMNIASIPLIFMGGPAGYAARQALSLAVPMSFLKFSRDAEREADLLGMEYAYACGYDPAEFVHFFEKLKLADKHKHQFFIARAFSTHPMTEDRIRRAQHEINTMLPPKDEYVVTTSEFIDMRARLMQLSHRSSVDEKGNEVPTLRRREPSSKPPDDPDRPTLRKPQKQ
jgi:predicted Zn-dependent protease